MNMAPALNTAPSGGPAGSSLRAGLGFLIQLLQWVCPQHCAVKRLSLGKEGRDEGGKSAPSQGRNLALPAVVNNNNNKSYRVHCQAPTWAYHLI